MVEPTGPSVAQGSAGRASPTKLLAPSLRDDRLRRPRIASLLTDQTAPLVLVSAPAGFGKTTAVVDWLKAEGRRFAWVNLDDGDDEPHRFFSLVAEALRPIVGGDRTAGLVAGNELELGTSLWAAALLEDLAGGDEPFALVLDDLHQVTDPVITAVLDIVAASWPEGVQLVLITRSDPPMRLGRLRAAGQVAEIRAQQLIFSDAEGAELLQQLTGAAWSPTTIQALNERIEGWPVGLQLAGLSLTGHRDVEGFVQEFAGDDRYVADYLIEEVLDGEQPMVRQFLLETSVVEEMNPELCRALTGRQDAAEILDDLYQRNLFIVALGGGDSGEGGWYRYHHLFADLLRARLTATDPQRAVELLATAATWAEEHGQLDQALRYHLRLPERDSATAFACRHLQGLIRRGQISRHRSWLAQFPNEWIEADPELLLSRAESEVFGIKPQQALRDLDEVERLVTQGAGTVVPGRIELRRAMAAFYAGDHDTCLRDTANAIELMSDREHGLCAVGHLYRGVIFNILDDRDTAQTELALAATQAERGGNHYAALSAHMSLGALAIHVGDLHRAGYRFDAVEAMAETITTRGVEFPLRGAADVGLGLISLEQLDLDDASTHFRHGLHQLRSTTAIDYTLLGYCRWADAATLTGKGSEANEILCEARDYIDHFVGNAPTHMTQALAAARARALFGQGDFEQARQIERRAQATPNPRRGELLHPAFELRLLSVRLHLAAGNVATAQTEAQNLTLENANDVRFQIERAVLDGELALAADDPARARTALDHALVLAGPGQWARPFAEASHDVATMVLDRTPPWAPRLGAHLAARQATQVSDDRPQPLVVPLTARELEVLAEIAEGHTNAEIAERLFISVGTTKRHIANIFTKLDVNHRTEAAAHARRLGLLT